MRFTRKTRKRSTHELNSRFVRNSQRQPFAKGHGFASLSFPFAGEKSRAVPSRGHSARRADTAVVATKHSTTAEEVGARVPLSSVSATSRPNGASRRATDGSGRTPNLARVVAFAHEPCDEKAAGGTLTGLAPSHAGAMNENARRSTGDINTRGEKGEHRPRDARATRPRSARAFSGARTRIAGFFPSAQL